MRFLPAILILAISGMIAVPLSHGAYGQEISIATSADDHGGTFFGEGIVQVVINDPDADDDSNVEDIIVRIDADPDSGSGGTLTIAVPETSDSSGRFEFFLEHDDAVAVSPSDLDPINSEGVEGDGSCVSDCAPVVTFGPSGELQVDAELYEEVNFDLTAGDIEYTLKYEETFAEVELDRSNYGSDSFVYVFVSDQDANLNPTKADEFTVDPDSAPNSDLFALDGGSIESAVTFRETGDNTARFEGKYELGASMAFESESLALTLFDKANYGATLGADENDSQSTDEVSFTIGNTNGTVDVGGNPLTWDPELNSLQGSPALGGNVTISLKDPDANANSSVAEDIGLELSTPAGSAVIIATEIDINTGIFEATFQISPSGLIGGTQLIVQGGDLISVSYTDKRPADYATKIQNGQDPEKKFTLANIAIPGDPTTASTSLIAPTVSVAPLAGSQVTLSTTIKNNDNYTHTLVVLIEVRDSSGITVYLAWQEAPLTSNESKPIEVSWTPEIGGEYEIRTFAVSSLSDGFVLSEVASSTVQVT